MALFLFRFSPILITFLIYWIWLRIIRRRARIKGDVLPCFRDGPIYLLLISSLLVTIIAFVVFAFTTSKSSNKDFYQPPRLEEKKFLPSQQKPSQEKL